MKNWKWKKLLSLVMALAMMISLFPAALAEETDLGAEDAVFADGLTGEEFEEDALFPEEEEEFQEELPEDISDVIGEPEDALITEEKEPGEAIPENQDPENEDPAVEPTESEGDETASEGNEGSEAGEVPSEVEEPGDAEAEEAPEEASEEETEENAEESEEESEKKELPYGFAGLPEGYELSAEEQAAKAALSENGVVAALLSGEYVDGEVLFHADSQEYAELVAEAYSAELAYFNGHFGKLYLTDVTVAEAVEAAADMELPLPAVEPNWIVSEPVMPSFGAGAYSAQALFEQQTWQSWMDGTDYPDDALMDPTNPMAGYQYQHDMVNTYETWAVTTGAGVVVAVVDSGVDYDHQDLLGKVIPGHDFVDDDDDPMDEHGHGTHVAGIIAAAMGNGSYGAGIAPDVTIYAVRVLDANNHGQYEWIANGIRAAAESGAKIINVSIGGAFYSRLLQEAVNYAYSSYGATVIISMGNEGSNIKSWPAACSNVVAVAAVDAGGGLASYSNYGPWCDVAAPGSDVWSLNPGGDYVCWDGTSMAAPVVSGVAALYMSIYGNPGPAAMEAILKKAVNKGPAGAGTGIIDAAKLFSGDTTAPVIRLFEEDGTEVTASGKVSPQGYLVIQSGRGYTQPSSTILFTMDGSAPAVKNGNPTNGIWINGYDDSYYYSDDEQPAVNGFYLPLGGFGTDQTVTFKFMEVNGLAVPSKVTTLKVQIVPPQADKLNGVNIYITDAPGNVLGGQTVTLKAVAEGEYVDAYGNTRYDILKDAEIVWSVLEPAGARSWLNSKTGQLKVPKNIFYDQIVVQATSKTYDASSTELYIDIGYSPWVKSVKFTGKIPALYSGMSYEVDGALFSFIDVDGMPIDFDAAPIGWSSSNYSVAGVSWDGYGLTIYANGKGSATITGRTQDGSNKSVALKVSVKPSVQQINITGPLVIAPGTSASPKATTLPKDGANKKLVWYTEEDYSGITLDPKTGKVTVDRYVAEEGSWYTVYARPEEGPEASCEGYSFMVGSKASRVALSVNGEPAPKTLTLLSADLPTTDEADNQAWIEGYRVYDGDNSDWLVSYTSNKPDVVEVVNWELSWGLRAKKAGTATITVTALDGSNKKATLNVKVENPVSNFIIRSKSPVSFSSSENIDYYLVGLGKSVGNSVIFGDTFGKPTNTKLTWDYETHHVGFGSKMELYDYGLIGDSYGHVDDITVKNGTLSVKKTFGSTWDSYTDVDYENQYRETIAVKLTATATDGSGAYAEIWYIVTYSATKLIMNDTYAVFDEDGEYQEYSFKQTKNTMTLTKNSSGSIGVFYYGSWSGFTLSSSNPDIAGVTSSFNVIPGTKTGTAKITIKTTDGSNKSVSFSVKVVP